MNNWVSYNLVADPRTGCVVRRTHGHLSPQEQHLVLLRVSKKEWKQYRSGDLVSIASLNPSDLATWQRRVREEKPRRDPDLGLDLR